jgi:iron complex outermembrane receptor protein
MRCFATFAKKSRFATMRERYMRTSGTPANPDLNPEQAYH